MTGFVFGPPEWFVPQRARADCGVACLAMALRMSYEDVAALVPRDFNTHIKDVPGGYIGMTGDEMATICFDLGIPAAHALLPDTFKGDEDHHWRYQYRAKRVIYDLDALNAHIANGGRAILGVDSLNYEDGKHWIYADDGEVFDPSPGPKRYPDDGQVAVSEVCLIAAGSAS